MMRLVVRRKSNRLSVIVIARCAIARCAADYGARGARVQPCDDIPMTKGRAWMRSALFAYSARCRTTTMSLVQLCFAR